MVLQELSHKIRNEMFYGSNANCLQYDSVRPRDGYVSYII